MRPSLRLTAAVAVALTIAACGSDDPSGAAAQTTGQPMATSAQTAAAPTTGPNGSPTPVAAAGEDGSILLLVTRAGGGLELHQVDRRTRAATLVRRLGPPAEPATVVDATLSGGEDPTVCASWHRGPGEVYDDPRSTLLCYPAGSEEGREVPGVDRPAQVALSRDGDRLAWSLLAPGEQNPVFSTATFSGGQVGPMQRLRGDSSQPEDASPVPTSSISAGLTTSTCLSAPASRATTAPHCSRST